MVMQSEFLDKGEKMKRKNRNCGAVNGIHINYQCRWDLCENFQKPTEKSRIRKF